MNKLYLAHRGYSYKFKENTKEAFFGVFSTGFDGVEIDLRLTKDNILVLLHNEKLENANGELSNIFEYTLKEIKGFKPDILSFEEFLNIFNNKFKYINIDIKENTIYKNKNIEENIYSVLKKFKSNTEYIFSSYYPGTLNKIKELDSSYKTAILAFEEKHLNNICKVKSLDYISILDDALKDRDIKQYNKKIMIWSLKDKVTYENGDIIIQNLY